VKLSYILVKTIARYDTIDYMHQIKVLSPKNSNLT